MQPSPGKSLGEFSSAHRGTKVLQPPDQVRDELGEPIDRLAKLNEGIGPFFIDTAASGVVQGVESTKRPGANASSYRRPLGFATAHLCRPTFVVFQQPTQRFLADDVFEPETLKRLGRR